MSTEEMNAMRVKLGLKPLDPTPPSKSESTNDADDSNLSTMERLRLAKERRMDRERARTRRVESDDTKPKFTLGDASDDEEESATSWVEKHKKVLEEKKRAAAQAKQLEEVEEEQLQAPISVDGLRVVHDLDQLNNDAVLIIKDTHILDDDEGDALENVELVSVEKGKRYQEKIKKKSKYDVYDEDGNSKGVLAHYDEEEEEKNAQKKKGFVLGQGGSYKPVSEPKKSADSAPKTIAMVLEGAEEGDYGETFQFGSGPKLSSDFEHKDGDEDVTFGKKSGGAKKVKKLRKKKVDEEAMEAEPTAEEGSLLDSLAPVTASRLKTRQDRERLTYEEEDRAAEQRQKNLAKYQNALRSAAERSQAVFSTEAAPKSRFEEIAQRTRELAAKREKEALEAQDNPGAEEGVSYSALTDFALRFEAAQVKEEAPTGYYAQNPANGEAAMDIDDNEREDAPALQRVRAEPAAPKDVKAPIRVKEEVSEAAAVIDEGVHDESEESRVHETAARLRKTRGRKAAGLAQDEEPEAVAEVPVEVKEEAVFLPSDIGANTSRKAHQGLGATLALLMQTGAIEDSRPKAGKQSDRRMEAATSGGTVSRNKGGAIPDYYREIEIERKDEWGRDMTSKQAFKAFSADFSGRHSGKRKQEKKFQKFKEQMQQMRDSSSSAVASSLGSLQTAQRKAATPFVVLDSQKILARGTGSHDVELGDSLKQQTGNGKASTAPGGASTRPM